MRWRKEPPSPDLPDHDSNEPLSTEELATLDHGLGASHHAYPSASSYPSISSARDSKTSIYSVPNASGSLTVNSLLSARPPTSSSSASVHKRKSQSSLAKSFRRVSSAVSLSKSSSDTSVNSPKTPKSRNGSQVALPSVPPLPESFPETDNISPHTTIPIIVQPEDSGYSNNITATRTNMSAHSAVSATDSVDSFQSVTQDFNDLVLIPQSKSKEVSPNPSPLPTSAAQFAKTSPTKSSHTIEAAGEAQPLQFVQAEYQPVNNGQPQNGVAESREHAQARDIDPARDLNSIESHAPNAPTHAPIEQSVDPLETAPLAQEPLTQEPLQSHDHTIARDIPQSRDHAPNGHTDIDRFEDENYDNFETDNFDNVSVDSPVDGDATIDSLPSHRGHHVRPNKEFAAPVAIKSSSSRPSLAAAMRGGLCDPSPAIPMAAATTAVSSMSPKSQNSMTESVSALSSPASSMIFERNVQEFSVAATSAGASSSKIWHNHDNTHYHGEDRVAPALDASTEAIINSKVNPEDIDVISLRRPSSIRARSPTEASLTSLWSPGSPTMLDGAPRTRNNSMSVHPLTASHTGGSLSPDKLNGGDGRQVLSFCSFADVVHTENEETTSSDRLGRFDTRSQSALRSPSPLMRQHHAVSPSMAESVVADLKLTIPPIRSGTMDSMDSESPIVVSSFGETIRRRTSELGL